MRRCMTRRAPHENKKPEIMRETKELPKLRIKRNTCGAHMIDMFAQWLNTGQMSVATWSKDTVCSWSIVAKVAKEACDIILTETPPEGVHASGSASRLLGLRMPECVPTLEKSTRAELADALAWTIVREAMLEGLANTLTPCEAQVRGRTSDDSESPMEAAWALSDA